MRKYIKLHYLKIIFIYTLLSVLFLYAIFKYGITVAVTISEFLQKNNNPELATKEKYLPPPQLNSIPEATNSADLVISGFSVANQKVQLTVNDSEPVFIDSDTEGKFEQKINLSLGVNTIKAYTKDNLTLSASSNMLQIYYNDTPPVLNITDPDPTKTIRKDPFIEIKGNTDKTCKVYVNDHLVIVDNEGIFSYQVKLNDGENNFKISSIDPAQNKTEKEIKLTYRK